MVKLEFFFDCSSPWTYLAFEYLQTRMAGLDVEILWRPILVGGIFNTVNPSVYQSRETPVPLKAAYMRKDLADWARLVGVGITFPPPVFPVNSVKAMRGCLWLEPQGQLVPFARAVFEAYWRDDRDISSDAVLAEVCERAGADAQDGVRVILHSSQAGEHATRLQTALQDAVARLPVKVRVQLQ